MRLFHRREEETAWDEDAFAEAGLPEDAAAEEAPAQEEPAAEAAPPEEAETAPPEEDPAALFADREQHWQTAAMEVAAHWPQVREDMPGLVAKMAELSAQYGDRTLWQRNPHSLMREAAIELYGMPQLPNGDAIARAVQQAHADGMAQGMQNARAKAGLAPGRVHAPHKTLTEEERIIRDMVQARKQSMF